MQCVSTAEDIGRLLDIVQPIVNVTKYGWVSSVSLRRLRSRGGTLPQFPATLQGYVTALSFTVVSFINGRKRVIKDFTSLKHSRVMISKNSQFLLNSVAHVKYINT